MGASTFRWTSHGSDPNAPALLARRQRLIDAARREPVTNRVRYLRDLAAGRVVLDVGVVEHHAGAAASPRWLHRHLAEVASRCVGVDILPDAVAELAAQGFDVRLHDLEEGPLDDEFDLVVAGELIEHLDAPGPFLRHAAAMLGSGGRLVLTTPNPYMVHRAWKHLRGGYPDSADHALLLGPGNIVALGARSGLRLDAWRGILLKDLPGPRNRATALARRALAASAFSAECRCDSLIYELVPDATER